MGKHRAGTARKRPISYRPSFEQLETRAVPAATLSLAAGVLTVTGTTKNDTITLR